MTHSERPVHVGMPPLVLLVEGHQLLREALEHILSRQLGLERFEYAENGDAAIRKAARLEPELVLVDFSLPDISGLDAAQHILEHAPHAHIVLLIDTPEAAYRAAAEARGVTTCIAKMALWDELSPTVTKLLGEGTSDTVSSHA